MSESLLSYRGLKLTARAGVALAALGAAAAQAGPVQIVSQERSIAARAFLGAGGGEGDTEFVETQTAPDAGPFEQSARADATQEGYVAKSLATMNSTLDDDSFRFAGRLEWEVDDQGLNPTFGGASASFDVEVLFTLDEAYRFDFTTDLNTIRDEGGEGEGGAAEFRLIEQSGGGGFAAEGDSSGTLQAGTYRLSLTRFVTSGETATLFEGNFAEDYDIRLDLEQVDGGGGGGGGGGEPNPIPLPPAVWSGLAVMGFGLLNRCRRSRRA